MEYIFHRGQRLSCLTCPMLGSPCDRLLHPLQRVISFDDLLEQADGHDQCDAISFYTCPLCGEDKLSIEALYDHYLLQHHLQQQESSVEKVEFRCPICVCFRLENSTEYIDSDPGLIEHLISRHCFPSQRRYDEELELRGQFCSDYETELVRFLAIFLQPSTVGIYSDCDDVPLSAQNTEALDCPICFEKMDENHLRLLSCSHQFHTECIDRWLENSSDCPICRMNCK
ncbi:uncharacterized protein LOC126581151 isoform X2 [Anopheles aquasalis]|uniref:uncharacterized protein LOC126581151 isoform X2 n=1 Tax=Anopheles aquasalis TaxID=42839 RepID=UPI00215A6070|nr:uncharacterized protein LOC126581151 isoform X2 [Anopheles aquasalis]